MKKLIFLFFCLLHGQNAYEGQVLFDYSGTESGVFSSMVQDSIVSGFSFSQDNGDSSYFLIASVTQQEDNEFDLFLAALQDTSFPLRPRTWSVPGEGDEGDPLSLETLLVFMPGLDSTFVLELFDAFTDTSSFEDSTDLFSDFFTTFADNLYLGLSGELVVETVTDSSVIGSFNTIMIKPAFHFPPHTIFINNGEFEFYDIAIPELEISNEKNIPKEFELYSIYPNPFNSSTTIDISIRSSIQHTSLYIVDIGGRKIETIFAGKLRSGIHSFNWNSNQNPSGIYFSVLKIGNSIETKKLMLIK
ncbi:MAG: T9SS type A sorting domain-containing protein [Candidatus Marinimicrobia bacterium]|nr:T9SS type A sorting domain-containing protein [Candidatus Neomarinimicrobiota bacterium]